MTTKLEVLVEQFGEHGQRLTESVNHALETKAWESGHLTGTRLQEMLESFKDENLQSVRAELVEIKGELREIINNARSLNRDDEEDDNGGRLFFGDNDDEEEAGGGGGGGGGGGPRVRRKYVYGGRFHAVPQGYALPPRPNLMVGLRCWLMEQVVSVDGSDKIRPLRKIKSVELPPSVLKQLQVNWMPILKFLEPVLQEVPLGEVVTEERLQQVHQQCIDFLKARVSYVWKKGRNHTEYCLGTWALKVSYGEVMKSGTDADKAQLKEPTKLNKQKRAGGAPRKRTAAVAPKYPARQKKQRVSGGVRLPDAPPGGEGRQGVSVPGRASLPGVGGGGGGGGGIPIAGGGATGVGTSSGGGTSEFEEAFFDAEQEVPTDAMMDRLHAIEVWGNAEAQADIGEKKHKDATRLREKGFAFRPMNPLRNYGDVSAHDRRRTGEKMAAAMAAAVEPPTASPMMRQGGRGSIGRTTGVCCVKGCAFSSLELVHRCASCKGFVHTVCVEVFNDLSEDERYCDVCIRLKKT